MKLRVSLGGHHVPADVVHRRFGRSLSNFFKLYVDLGDEWTLFDNSGRDDARVIAMQSANHLTVTEAGTWKKLQKLSKTF